MSSAPGRFARAASLPVVIALAGCEGIQSALDPAGPSAREIAALWWYMAAGAAAVFLLVLGLLLRALNAARRPLERPLKLVVLCGLALPIVTLSALVPFNVRVAAGVSAPRTADTVTVRVRARQWWWDIEYDDGRPGGTFRTANELRLPLDTPVELTMTSDDVIHSLWLPSIAGKLDVIPGHTTRLVLTADETGVYRGQCAEFCGRAHAKMSFIAVVVTPDAFAEWAERQRGDAVSSTDAAARAGARLFAATGCALCHTVRGHRAWGRVGPDLTHVGGRLTIGAALLENTPDHVALWIGANEHLKPGNRMPDYEHLDAETRASLAAYLASLR